jgi:hypothetical protein
MKLRSPCVALSGHGDYFDSIFDLCGSARDGVFLGKAVIPHLDMGGGIGYSIECLPLRFLLVRAGRGSRSNGPDPTWRGLGRPEEFSILSWLCSLQV